MATTTSTAPDATDAQASATPDTSSEPLAQVDVSVATADWKSGSPKRVRRPAKLLDPELGVRPARHLADGMRVLVTPEEADQVADGDLVVPPGARHPNGDPYAFRVLGRDEPRPPEHAWGAGAWGTEELRRGTYVPLRLDIPREPAGAVDTPAVGSPPPKSVEQPERPLVDPEVWRWTEQEHTWGQKRRMEAAWESLTERERADTLERLEKDVLWDRLSLDDQEKALEAIRADHEWPTLYEKLEAEEREHRKREAKEKRAREAAHKRDMEKMSRQIEEMRERAEADAKAAREREEREEREAKEERQRRAEEERERLQRERDELVSTEAA